MSELVLGHGAKHPNHEAAAASFHRRLWQWMAAERCCKANGRADNGAYRCPDSQVGFMFHVRHSIDLRMI